MAQVSDPSCIFCKIIAGQIPCHKIYEDEVVFAFLDIGPLVPGHTLVIPKGHFENVLTIPADVLAEVNRRMPKLVKAVLAVAGAPAAHVLVNNGGAAQQSVFHLHYHILPRTVGDSFHIPWKAGTLEGPVGKQMAAAIAEKLGSTS